MRNNMHNFRVFGPDETARTSWTMCMKSARKPAGRLPAGRRGWRRAVAGWPRNGDAFRTHAGRLAGRLSAQRRHVSSPLTKPSFTSSTRCSTSTPNGWPCPKRAMARTGVIAESADHLHRVAAGSQRLHPSGPRLSRRGGEQEPGGHAHLSAARCELPADGCRALPEEH